MTSLAERLRKLGKNQRFDVEAVREVWPEVCAVVGSAEELLDTAGHEPQLWLDAQDARLALARRMEEEEL